jgi:hypothetical protein
MKALRWILPVILLFVLGLFYYSANNSDQTPRINKDIVKPIVTYKSISEEELLIIGKNCNDTIEGNLREISAFGDELINLEVDKLKLYEQVEIFKNMKSNYQALEKPSDPICTVALSPADSYLSTTNYLLDEKIGK